MITGDFWRRAGADANCSGEAFWSTTMDLWADTFSWEELAAIESDCSPITTCLWRASSFTIPGSRMNGTSNTTALWKWGAGAGAMAGTGITGGFESSQLEFHLKNHSNGVATLSILLPSFVICRAGKERQHSGQTPPWHYPDDSISSAGDGRGDVGRRHVFCPAASRPDAARLLRSGVVCCRRFSCSVCAWSYTAFA